MNIATNDELALVEHESQSNCFNESHTSNIIYVAFEDSNESAHDLGILKDIVTQSLD